MYPLESEGQKVPLASKRKPVLLHSVDKLHQLCGSVGDKYVVVLAPCSLFGKV